MGARRSVTNFGAGADTFTGSGIIADVVFGDAGVDILNGGDGNDTLDGGADDDMVFGEAGNDVLDGGLGTDHVEGGDGNDRIVLSAGSSHETEVYLGGTGTDTVANETGADFTLDLINFVSGTTNVDEIEVIEFNASTLLGTSGANSFDFTGVQFTRVNNDVTVTTISTGAGDDVVLGSNVAGNTVSVGGRSTFRYELGAGADTFTGSGTIIDFVFGGDGDDTLTGGGGSDTFIFTDGFGNDTITDYESTNGAEDIDLSDVTSIVDFVDLAANHLSQIGSDTVIDDGLGNTITLINVNVADLDATDFIF